MFFAFLFTFSFSIDGKPWNFHIAALALQTIQMPGEIIAAAGELKNTDVFIRHGIVTQRGSAGGLCGQGLRNAVINNVDNSADGAVAIEQCGGPAYDFDT